MLWSDPQPGLGRAPSKRGVGVAFGADVTKNFLQRNGLQLVVRSHEVKEEGYEVEHDGCCITIFSAPNYCACVRVRRVCLLPPHPLWRHRLCAAQATRWATRARSSASTGQTWCHTSPPSTQWCVDGAAPMRAYLQSDAQHVLPRTAAPPQPHPSVRPMRFANPMLQYM
jgi:hypothetical protein